MDEGLGNSYRIAYALLLVLIVVGCSTEKSEQENLLSQMGPPTDWLSSLSDSALDSVRQLYSNRQDIVAESYRRRGNADVESMLAISNQSKRAWFYLGDSASTVFPTLTLYGLKDEPLDVFVFDPLDGSIFIGLPKSRQIARCVRVSESDCECTSFTVPDAVGMGVVTDMELDDAKRLLWVVTTKPDLLVAFSLTTGKPMFRAKPTDSTTNHHFSGLLLLPHDSILIAATATHALFLFERNKIAKGLTSVMQAIPLPSSLARSEQTGALFVASMSKGICRLNSDFSEFHILEHDGILLDGCIRKLVCRGSHLAAYHEGYGATRLVKYELDSTEHVIRDAQGVELDFQGESVGGFALENRVVSVLYYPKLYDHPVAQSTTEQLPKVKVSLLL